MVNGYGITLSWEGMSKEDKWYLPLWEAAEFMPLDGADQTGNVYYPENVQHFRRTIEAQEKGQGRIDIAVSDGGFEIGKDAQGAHLENIQELLSVRCILAEHLIALLTLKAGGNFVCKLFDTFSGGWQSGSPLSLLRLSAFPASSLCFPCLCLPSPLHERLVDPRHSAMVAL